MAKVKQLTPKQVKFCRNVASGMTATESYKNAYDAGNMKESTIYTESSRLMVRQDIQDYISTISKPFTDAINISNMSARQRQISFIEERIQHCKQLEDETSIVRYTDMLNKLYGLYKDGTEQEKQGNNVSNLDTSQLIQLLDVVS